MVCLLHVCVVRLQTAANNLRNSTLQEENTRMKRFLSVRRLSLHKYISWVVQRIMKYSINDNTIYNSLPLQELGDGKNKSDDRSKQKGKQSNGRYELKFQKRLISKTFERKYLECAPSFHFLC